MYYASYAKNIRHGSHVKKRKKSIGVKFIFAGVIILCMFVLMDMRIRPIIRKISTYQSQIIATRLINNAVYSEMNAEYFDYEHLITVHTTNTGEISTIESNIININMLKTQITQQINESLKGLDTSSVDIAIGTMSGIQMLYGHGPEIKVKMTPGGYVEAKVISSFESAGINQTMHRIILEINVNIAAIIPGYTTSVDVPCNFIIAETVLIGRVPEAYTHVITGNNDLISNINDYGAE